MKTRGYLIIALCALHITSAQAFSIFGYDVTSWATRAFSAVRSYFTPATQPMRPAPPTPPMRQAPPTQTIATDEQVAAPEFQSVQVPAVPAHTQQTAGRRMANIAGHFIPEGQKVIGGIGLTSPAGSTTTTTPASASPELKTLDLTKFNPSKIEKLLEDPHNIDPIITLALHTPIYKIYSDNLKTLLSHPHIAQELSPNIMAYFTNLISLIDTSLKGDRFKFQQLVTADIFLDNILNMHPALNTEFISLLSERFDILMESYEGRRILKKLLEHPQIDKQAISKTLLPKIMDYFKDSLPLIADSSKKYVEIRDLFDDITQRFPETKEIFISLILEHFELLANSFKGQQLLEFILKYPETKIPLKQLALEHFATLANSYGGIDFLIKMIQQYPDMAEKLFPLTLKHFTSLIDKGDGQKFFHMVTDKITNTHDNVTAVYNNLSNLIQKQIGYEFVINLINKYPQIMKGLIQPKHFLQLIQHHNGIHFLTELINTFPESVNLLGPIALEHFLPLTKIYNGGKLFEAILNKNSDFNSEFDVLLSDNFTTLVQHYPEISFLNDVLNTPERTKKFAPLILKNITALIQSPQPESIAFIINSITQYPKIASELSGLVINHFDTLIKSQAGVQLLQKIIENDARAKDIFLTKLLETHLLFYPFTDLNNPPFTQTKQLLKVNFFDSYMALKSGGLIDYECCPELQAMTKRVIDLEAQEQAKGRYTFVHAHQWQYHFFQEIYTDLWNIVHNQPSSAYRFVRFEQPPSSPWTTWENVLYIKEHEKMRQRLVDKSITGYYTRNPSCQFHMLFMNYGLFANTYGSNTGNYIKVNRSENPINLNIAQLLEKLQLYHYFNPNAFARIIQELKALQDEHTRISQYGGGLLLSFTPEALKKAVYPVRGGGEKRTVQIEGIGETSDAQIILNTLRTSPEKITNPEKMEFVCVLSHDCTLIPNNGLDIYEFNAADQEALAQWREKKDILMQQIKIIIDSKRAQEQARAVKPRL